MQLRFDLAKDESGQDLLEYALVLGFVAVALGVLIFGAGGNTPGVMAPNSEVVAATSSGR